MREPVMVNPTAPPESSLNYRQLLEVSNSEIDSAKSEIGFDDLRSAFEAAKTYWASDTIPADPGTGARYNINEAPEMVFDAHFDPEANFENITSEDLKTLHREALGVMEEEGGEATEEELERDIGEEIAEMPEATDVPEEVPEEVLQSAPEEQIEEIQQITEEGEEEYDILQNIQAGKKYDLIVNSLKNLIKVAADLDKEGKTKEAEEIHLVIRKYQERMK